MMTVPAWLGRALLAAACLTMPLAAVSPVAPASANPVLEEGAALPWRWETALPSYVELPGQSPGYIMHARSQYDENRGRTYSIVRVSDGAVMHTFERPYHLTSLEAPRLVDRSLVEMVTGRPSTYNPDHVNIHDLVTGARTSIDISAHGSYLHGDDEWALVTDPVAGADYRVLSFVWADGHTVTVSELQVRSNVVWKGGDTDTAYVTVNGTSYAIDAATGAVTPLTMPDGSPFPLYAVTVDTLVARSDQVVDGRWGYRFSSIDRSTGALVHQVDVPYDTRVRYYLPYGRGIAAVYLPDGGTLYRFDLRPFDMSTGALQSAVATGVVVADAMGNGQVALMLGDVPTGRLAVTPGASGGLQPVSNLPHIGYRSMRVGLSDGVAVTSFESQTGLWSTRVGTGQDWQQEYPSSTPEDTRTDNFAYAGDTVLTRLPDTYPGATRHYRVAWPGGSRDLDDVVRLGRGGRYLIRHVPGGTGRWEVQEVRSGTVVASGTDLAARFLDGTWLWTAPDPTGTMTGTDLTGAEPPRTATIPAACLGNSGGVVSVVGRWALAHCGDLSVVDLWGVMQPWPVPADDGYVQLGNGFVAWLDVTPHPAGGQPTINLDVADLSVDHDVHTYGPLRGVSYPPGPAYAVDDSGSPDLVYVDPTSRVRHVNLDWLGSAPLTRPDGTAPALTAGPALPRVVRSSQPVTMTPSWTYVDPEVPHEPASGLASFDVRSQPYPAAGDGAWGERADWQGLSGASVTVQIQPGEGQCFQARARDTNGNTSAWSEPACTYVDDSPPTLRTATGSRSLLSTLTASLNYSFGADDDYGVASYDVAVRSAPRGKPLGSWQTRWVSTRRSSVSVDARHGTQRCFRFRARDVAGNISAWSPARCSTLPVDDREFSRHGRVSSGGLDIAIGGTYSELRSRGASVTLAGQTGRTVALWVIAGPYQGPVDVYADGRRLGRVGLIADWQRRSVVTLRAARPWSGPVRVVAVSGKPARIDAIAVIR